MDIKDLVEFLKTGDAESLRLLSAVFGGGKNILIKDKTLDEGFVDYNKLIEFNLAPKTIACAKTAERRFLKFVPGNRLIRSIELRDAQNLMMKIAETAPLACHNYLKIYRTIFNHFVDWDYCSINPFLKVVLPKRQNNEPITFTNEEIEILYDGLTAKGKFVIADLIKFLSETGMRPGEGRLMRFSDINFRSRSITIGRSFKTKTRRIRTIPLTEKMEVIINRVTQRYLAKKKILPGFVFAQSNGKPYQLDTISKSVKKIIKEKGMREELHLYCLRATAATRWANSKIPIFTVAKMLGHSKTDLTMKFYAGSDVESMREAVEGV